MNSVESKTETITGPLSENPAVVELLALLAKNKAAEQYADFGKLVSCVSSMEEQLNRTVTELSAVRKELRTLQESLSKEDKANLSGMAASLETAVRRAREQLHSIRENIIRAAQTAVNGLKDKGVIGLHDALEALGVRKAMTALQTHLNHTARALETGIARMEAVRQEMQSVGGHVRNIGRALSGKERLEVKAGQTQNGKGAVLTPLRRVHSALRRAENLAGRAVEHLEKLERTAQEKKPSIRETLKNYESRPARPKEAVEKEQAAR